MKAKIRNTNIEIDVQPFYDETGYFAGFKDGYEYYRAEDLVFPDTMDWDKTDWSSFRREAAKDILCALAGNKDYLKVIGRIEPETMLAVQFADELIKVLRNG